jgi:gluconokinase
MGVSGTGKSAVGRGLAERLGAAFVEGDDHHPTSNIEKMAAGSPLTDADRLPWLERLAEVIARRRTSGTPTVVTCSALRRAYRDVLRAGVPDGCLFFLHLHAEPETLRERMARRDRHFMPASLLDSQLETLEPLRLDECGATLDVTPPLDVVVAQAAEVVRAAQQGRP